VQFSELIKKMWVLADDEFLCMASHPARHGIFTLMSKQAVYYPNLYKVYSHLMLFYNLVTEAIHLDFKIIGKEAHFCMSLDDPAKDPDYTLREYLLLIWHRFPSWLIGRLIPLKRITFDYKAPEHKSEYRLMFPGEVKFEQPETCLVFDTSLLQAPVVQTPKSLRRYLRHAPYDWFVRQAYYQVYTQRVLQLLIQSKAFAEITMDEIAGKLHLTTRTLRRKLFEEDTTFQQLKDNARRDEAIHLLSQPSLPISQISAKLGFSEPSAFTRAFKDWMGVTPKAYRGK